MSNPATYQAARVQTLGATLITLLIVAGVLAPFGGFAATLIPLQFGNDIWRFNLESIFLTTVPHIAVAIGVIGTFGLFGEMRRAIRGAAIGAIALSVLIAATLPLFLLDFTQLRGRQPQPRLGAFTAAGAETALMGALLIPALIWFGRRGLLVGKKPEVEPRARAGQGLIVAQD